ncbi:MAG: hypothetical protein V4562_08560 [Pseudomonadota bacterium]
MDMFLQRAPRGELPPPPEDPASAAQGAALALGEPAPAALRTQAPPEYWDDMFNAVTERLGKLVCVPQSLGGESAAVRAELTTDVMECVAALDQLHGVLGNQMQRCAELEREVATLQAALAQASLLR